MNTFLQIISNHSEAFLRGIGVTIQLALIIWGSGLAIGTLLGILSTKYKVIIGIPTRLITFILSGIPVLVYLYWAHYPMQTILGVVINPFITAAIVLSTINIFSVSDQIRTQLIDFPEQYTIAAKVCGLSQRTTIFRIQMPILLRQVTSAPN